MTAAVLKLAARSGLATQFDWPDGAGGVADLTGWSVALADLDPALVGLASAAIVTPAAGRVELRIDWSDSTPVNRKMSFRFVFSKTGHQPFSSFPIWVQYE